MVFPNVFSEQPANTDAKSTASRQLLVIRVPSKILAIAIEDRIDVWYGEAVELDEATISGDPAPKYTPTFRLVSKPIAEGGNYVQAMYDELKETLLQLRLEMFKTEDVKSIFKDVEATVVSVPGVVEQQQILVQVPVWNSIDTSEIQLKLAQHDKEGFHKHVHFPQVLETIVNDLIEDEARLRQDERLLWSSTDRKRFAQTVWVCNDTSACAAFENDVCEADAPDFSYTKMHAGVNMAIVEATNSRQYAIRLSHGEIGHTFPLIHPMDQGIDGVCVHHGWCLEGLAAAHSFTHRARRGSNDTFRKWGEYVSARERQVRGQRLDNDLMDFILGKDQAPPESGNTDGIEILAHYVGQLVWAMALSAMSRQIVLGGRMARPRVLDAIRRNIVQWANGYPRRPELSAGIENYIRLSRAKPEQQDFVEVRGAFAIAAARASDPGARKEVSLWLKARLQPLQRGIVQLRPAGRA